MVMGLSGQIPIAFNMLLLFFLTMFDLKPYSPNHQVCISLLHSDFFNHGIVSFVSKSRFERLETSHI
jgi:hypothetical protein